MWNKIIYVSMLSFFDLLIKTNACDCSENLLLQLNNEINKINNIIQQINKKHLRLRANQYCTTVHDNYDNELSMKRAIIALNAAGNTQEQQINPIHSNISPQESDNDLQDRNVEGDFYQTVQPTRRNDPNIWNNDFYAALTKALKTEIRQRPDLMNDLKDDIESLNIINPDA